MKRICPLSTTRLPEAKYAPLSPPFWSVKNQILCCLVGGIFAGICAAGSDVKNMYFIWGDGSGGYQSPLLTAFLKFWSFIIIFTNFVPISLLVTLDMVKMFQSRFIAWDREMYHEAREFNGDRRSMPTNVRVVAPRALKQGYQAVLSPFFDPGGIPR